MRINITTIIGIVSTSFAFAQAAEVPFTSCIDKVMVNVITVDQKNYIVAQPNPENEKVKVYMQYHSAKYTSTKDSCYQQAMNQQTIDHASATQAQQTAAAAKENKDKNSMSGDEILNAAAVGAAALASNYHSSRGVAAGNANAVPAENAPAPVRGEVVSNTPPATERTPATAAGTTQASTDTKTGASTTDSSSNSTAASPATESTSVTSATPVESAAPPQAQFTSGENNLAASDVKEASAQAPAQAEAVKDSIPQAGAAAKDVAGAPTSPDVPAPPSEITAAATAKTNQIKSTSSTSLASLEAALANYPQTAAAVMAYKAKLDAYLNVSKTACVKTAETADLLCVESPGLSKIKTMMDVAGPVLAVVGSASKSCSSLGKLTSLASTGLTIARGVCLGSKFMCDTACGKTVLEIKAVQAAAAKVSTIFQQENSELTYQYNCGRTLPMPLCAKLVTDRGSVPPQLAKLGQDIAPENAPVAGTSTALATKCQGYGKEVAQMAVSLIGVIKAAKTAKECEKQLSTAGASPLTTQQYCEIPANSVNEMCKCYKNLAAPGCPNAIAAADTGKGTPDGQGSNIKSTAGVNGFATGAPAVVPRSGLTGLSGSGAGATNPTYTNFSRGSVGGVNSDGSKASDLGSTAGSASDGEAVKAETAKKKWDFGGFFSSGGGGGSSAGGKNNLNGSGISEKNMNALNRKIASEQFATEVSSASGKSNWEKVKRMYFLKENSLINGK